MLIAVFFGILAGCLFSIPAGPVSILIFRNTALLGIKNGLFTLLGLITAEILYILLYFFGLNKIILSQQNLLDFFTMLGGAFIVFLGLNSYLAKKKVKPIKTNEKLNKNLYKNFLSGFTISLLNPAILIFLIAVISFFLKNNPNLSNNLYIGTLLISVEIGTAVWFLIIIIVTLKLKDRFKIFFENKIQIISSVLLIILGSFIFIKNIYEVFL